MPFFNKIRKLNSVRWLFLSLGIVAVLALTVMNIYSLYALRESTIESAKDNKKSAFQRFSKLYYFYSPPKSSFFFGVSLLYYLIVDI